MKENSNKTSWMQENKFVIVNILLTNIWWVSFPVAFICKDKMCLLLGFIAFSINLVNIIYELGKNNKAGEKMIAGIKECHIKKFSRLVQELEQLRQDIKEYCPDVVFRLNNTCMMELGIDKGFEDYPYIIEENLICDSINDVGTDSYCLVDEDREKELAYSKNRSRSKKGNNTSGKTIRIKKGSERYKEEVYPYWNGYRNGHGDLTEEQFALLYLDIELYD